MNDQEWSKKGESSVLELELGVLVGNYVWGWGEESKSPHQGKLMVKLPAFTLLLPK